MYVSAIAPVASFSSTNVGAPIAAELQIALERNELLLDYQPRLDAETGEMIAADALLFWPHPHLGLLLSAGELPPSDASLITRIGGWAVRTACADAAGWQDDTVVSVRIAAGHRVAETLLAQVVEALDLSELPAARLELAFGEASVAALNIEDLLTLSAIRDLGVALSLAPDA